MDSPDTLYENMPRQPDEAMRVRMPATSHALIESGVGARIREARIAAGFKRQAMFARAVGVNPVTLNRHEQGRVIPCIELIRSYAKVLGVSASYLQYGIGDPQIPHAVHDYLEHWQSKDLLEETKARLLRVPWSLIAAGEIDTFQVHALARLIDSNLRPRSSSENAGSADSLSGAGGALRDDTKRQHEDSSRPVCTRT